MILAWLLVLLTLAPLRAAGSSSGESQRYLQAMIQGVEHYRQGRNRLALLFFKQSLLLKPDSGKPILIWESLI